MTFHNTLLSICQNPDPDQVRRKGHALVLKTFLEECTPEDRSAIESWIGRIDEMSAIQQFSSPTVTSIAAARHIRGRDGVHGGAL